MGPAKRDEQKSRGFIAWVRLSLSATARQRVTECGQRFIAKLLAIAHPKKFGALTALFSDKAS